MGNPPEGETPANVASPQDIFRQVTLGRGIAYQRNLITEPARSVYDQLIRRSNDLILAARQGIAGLPAIHFDLIVNDTVNAFAFRAADQYFIGFHTGTNYLLRLVIGRMLADPNTFPEIGDPSKERTDLPPILDYVAKADQLCDANDLVSPCDPVRSNYAAFLHDQAAMFFVGHEVGHISRGHVDFLWNERQEKPSDMEEAELKIERQSLETHADQRTIASRVESLQEAWLSGEYQQLAPWVREGDDVTVLFRDLGTALAIAFRLVGDRQFADAELERAYPSMRVRWAMAVTAAAHHVEGFWDPALLPSFKAGVTYGWSAVHDGFATALRQPDQLKDDEFRLTRPEYEHLMRLVDYGYSKMRARLRPYSYDKVI